MKKTMLRKTIALLLSTLLIMSSFPMTAFAAQLEQKGDDYSVNMPATGTDTLDLTDKAGGFTFRVYDDGGADANYSNSCDGTLLITAPENTVMKIGGTVSSESGYDYLYIYDGDSTVPLGSEKYCGDNVAIDDMYSTSNQLTVRFKSDSSYVYSGVDLTVTIVDASGLARIGYSYAGTVINSTVEKGTEITLPVFADIFTAQEGAEFISWKCGEESYNENDVVTVTENMTFEALVDEPPVVLGDDETGWYAKMPIRGTVTADLSDKQDGFVMHVYDNGGADGNYSDNCSGYMRLIAPEGYVLKVSGSGRSESASYDWLTIYDGDTQTVLGSEKYAGRPFTVPELTTTGNVLKLYFRSDTSSTYSGLDLTVTLLDYSNYSFVNYSYNGTTKGSFIANGTSIQLSTFTSLFELPERYHFTAWQSGGIDYQEGDSYTVSGDVTFEALVEEDPVIFEDGDGGYYAKLPKTGTLTADLSDWNVGDTLKVYDNGGKDKPYSYSCDGYLRIEAPEGYRLSVNGTYSTYPYYDWIYLYDGDTSHQLGSQFMGYNKTMNDYYSTGNVLIVYLYSYYGDSNMGCDLNVTIIDPDDLVTVSFDAGDGSGTMEPMQALSGARIVLPECGFTLPDKTYFDYYTDGTNTYNAGSVYTVTGDATLTAVYIEKIIATYKFGEETATAECRKGTRLDLPYFNEYFTLPYRKEFYRWASGGNEYYESQSYTFNEDVTFTAMLNDLPIIIEKNDGTYYATLPKNEHVAVDMSTGYDNGFTFKLYDNGNENGYYAYNCDGSLTFTAPEGYIFVMSGSIVTEQWGGDILSIYDSDMTTLLGGQTYSGNTTIDELRSSSNTVKVLFVTDSIGIDHGFTLTVRMINVSTLINVTFDAGEGSGTMDAMTQIAGEAFTLPDYGFTPPSGKIFNGYSDGTNTYWPGTVTFTESKTLTAQWVEATGITYTYKNNDHAISYPKGSTITLPEFTSLFTLPSGMHFVGWQEKFSGDMYNEGDSYTANDPTVMIAILEILYEDGNGGYYALMPVNNPNDDLTLDLSDKPVGFSFTLYDDGGPDNNYADNNDAVLIVHSPENTVLTVTGSGALGYYNDYLRFYNGASWRDGVLGDERYTDAFEITEPLMTDGNDLEIYLHTNDEYNYDGFELTITIVAPVTVTYEFDGETQTVASREGETIILADFDDLFESDDKEFLYWQNGDNTYDEGDEYLVSEDVTFTAVTRLMPTATVDGNGALVKADIGGDGVITTIGPIPYPMGTTMPLPHANLLFDSPEGKYFGGWSYNDRVYAAGEEFTITEDITLTAIWRDPTAWERLNEQLQTASGTITLTENVTADVGAMPLSVPMGVTVTVDLNGYTLDGTNAALDGTMITVYGALTLTDSSVNGALTGGNIIAYENGVFTPEGTVAENFEATVTHGYRASDDNYNYENFIYSVSWYPTLADAMNAAAERIEFEDYVTLPEGMSFRWYLVPRVSLLRDVTIAEGEALTVNSDDGIDLDLNGHTFDNRGTFNGGTTSWRYTDDGYEEVFNPTYISIDSTTLGVFRSSGTIGVILCPWSADTYYFTDGEISGFIGADGGDFHISGGHFTDLVMFNNGNEDANVEVELCGDAEFDELEHMIYANDGGPTIHMTISDNVRVASLEFGIMGDGVVNYPVLTINGGYFTVDPTTWLETPGIGENAVEIAHEPEQFDSQADWAADSSVYTWRVPQPAIPVFAGHSLILGDDIGVNFYTRLDDAITADQGAYMLFTLPNGTTKQIFVKDTVTKDNRTDDSEVWTEQYGTTTYYVFKCSVAAKEMTSAIKAQIISSDGKCVGQMTYTVKEYADYILDESNGFDEVTKALVKAMLNYGASAQAFFGVNVNTPANADLDDADKAVIPFAQDELASFEAMNVQKTADIDGVPFTYEGSQFVLTSKTTYRMRFSSDLDGYTVTYNGTPLDAEESGEYRIVTIAEISPDELFSNITLTFTPAEGTPTELTFNPSSYILLALDNDDEALTNVVTALYRYYEAARDYANA